MTLASPARRPILGTVVIVVTVLAAAYAIAVALVPPAVGPEQWSYPLAFAPNLAGQVGIGIHHVVLAAGFLVVLRSGLAGSSRLGTAGGVSAALLMALFGVLEVVSGLAGNEPVDGGVASTLGSVYGVFTIALAAASIVFGIAILRARVWTGPTRFTLLVSGIYLVVPLIPAQFAPLPLRAAALAIWCLLYVGLGLGLVTRRALK